MHSQTSLLRGQESSAFKMSSPSPTGARIRDSTMRHCSFILTFRTARSIPSVCAVRALHWAMTAPYQRAVMRRWKDPKPPTPSPTFEPYNGLDDVPLQDRL